ncbi:hypothetical protein NX059_010860 [Plenodomus lindquistii]|nr:hypothetical protein NX059_010860 [Plenodomus lindquistii]
MGIPQLREEIEKCEEIVPRVKLAEDHYNNEHTKGRPFKVAIDAADWSFHNVSPAQVAFIRRGEPAACPVEKAIFRRLCKLLAANIRPVYVFDGRNIPAKRGKRAGRIVKYDEQELLKKVLYGLGVSYIEAPGEAEAECCRLQVLNLVDAVWSVDSDCLIFGCTLWIRDYRVAKDSSSTKKGNADTKRDQKLVRVVRAEQLQAKSRLKREGCVLFAMMAGGDYGKGISGCGASTALMAAQSGLGISLCRVKNQAECKDWRNRVLLPFLATKSIKISVPQDYPNFELLQWYNHPTTHSDEYLREHAAWNMYYESPIRESEFLQVGLPHLNMTRNPYLNHIGPVLLSQYIVNRPQSVPREAVFGIKLVKTRAKASAAGQEPSVYERKLTFCPNDLTHVSSRTFDSWIAFKEKNQSAPFDPNFRVECEIPNFLLQKVLPAEVLDPPSKEKKALKKRKDLIDLDLNFDTDPVTKKSKNVTAVINRTGPSLEYSPQADIDLAPNSAIRSQPLTTPSRQSVGSRISKFNHLVQEVSSDEDSDRPTPISALRVPPSDTPARKPTRPAAWPTDHEIHVISDSEEDLGLTLPPSHT